MIFCNASGIIAVSTALNAISLHAACTAVFVAVAAVIAFLGSSIRTLGRITILGWIGVVSILSGSELAVTRWLSLTLVMIVTIAVGLQDRPSDAPQTGPWDKNLLLFAKPTFAQGMSTVAGLVFATCNPPTL